MDHPLVDKELYTELCNVLDRTEGLVLDDMIGIFGHEKLDLLTSISKYESRKLFKSICVYMLMENKIKSKYKDYALAHVAGQRAAHGVIHSLRHRKIYKSVYKVFVDNSLIKELVDVLYTKMAYKRIDANGFIACYTILELLETVLKDSVVI